MGGGGGDITIAHLHLYFSELFSTTPGRQIKHRRSSVRIHHIYEMNVKFLSRLKMRSQNDVLPRA